MSTSLPIRERLVEELKAAMKGGDKAKVAAVRLIQAALKDKDIESRGAGRGQSTDDEILAVMQKMIKQRQESAAIFAANARPELAETENGEIAVISSFLPSQLSEDEVKAAVFAAVNEAGATSMKDMGKVVAVLKGKYAGQMDFAKASGLVKVALSG
ncbi:MAG: GatB/YqeY domain-containing protein [Bosea sp. (in: a-proteobacteria)]